MSWTDRITVLFGAGAIVATLSVGTCSTNGRFDDLDRRFDDLDRQFDDLDRQFDDLQAGIGELRSDLRELRSLVIEAIKTDTGDEAEAQAER